MNNSGRVVATVTISPALGQPLEATLQVVERRIVLAVVDLLGPNSHGISELLHCGHKRIDKHLDNKMRDSSLPDIAKPGDPVVCRITFAQIFTRPLEDTIRIVEREILRAACIAFDCNERTIRTLLHIRHERFKRHLDQIQADLWLAGWGERP